MLRAFLLIVVGLAGDPEHGKTFHAWGNALAESSERLGVAPEHLVHLVDQPAEGDKKVTGRATREEVTKALDRFATLAGPDDLVFITLIGHGSFDGRAAKFNMPGPDMSPADFAPLLGKLKSTQVVFVNTASASGPFVDVLSGPGRTLVTATRNGAEHYATLFGGHFVEALGSEAADADKNRRVSVLEAFLFAKAEVTRAYEREGLLATEHAVLDDNGDGTGSTDAGPEGPDGVLASTFTLGGAAAAVRTSDDPVLARLYAERDGIQRRIDELRVVRTALTEDEFLARLEPLLVELALKNREIREAGGGV